MSYPKEAHSRINTLLKNKNALTSFCQIILDPPKEEGVPRTPYTMRPRCQHFTHCADWLPKLPLFVFTHLLAIQNNQHCHLVRTLNFLAWWDLLPGPSQTKEDTSRHWVSTTNKQGSEGEKAVKISR